MTIWLQETTVIIILAYFFPLKYNKQSTVSIFMTQELLFNHSKIDWRIY